MAKTGTGAPIVSPWTADGVGTPWPGTERTHVYHMVGDSHMRGAWVGQSLLSPYEMRVDVVLAPATPVQIGDVIRGNTSGVGLIVTRVDSSVSFVGEALNALPPLPAAPGGAFAQNVTPGAFPFTGETLTVRPSGATCVVSFTAGAQAYPQYAQFLGYMNDVPAGDLTPQGGDDTPVWYPYIRRARSCGVSSFTGTSPYFRQGDRVSSSSGGTAILRTVLGASLKLVRVVGAINVGDTLTNLDIPGGATGHVDSIESTWPTGEWAPYSAWPNVRGLGSYYEFQPQGNDIGGKQVPRIGPMSRLLPAIYARHHGSDFPLDRGSRMIQFSTLDPYDNTLSFGPALEGGIMVQVVRTTGTLPSGWIAGETVAATVGNWRGTVLGYNVAGGRLFVVDTNGEVLLAGNVVGQQSGKVATTDGAAWGWQKGSRHFEAWRANVAAALLGNGAQFNGAPFQHESIIGMSWEAELRLFASTVGCPFPSDPQIQRAFTAWIRDMRAELGDEGSRIPVTLWMHRVESQSSSIFIALPSGNLPVAFLLRAWIGAVPGYVPNVTICDSMALGYQMGADTFWLRTLDYVDLGEALFHHLRFQQTSIALGTGHELLPVGIITGQSQVVGFNQSGIAAFGDPQLFPSSQFRAGVNTVDPNLMIWNTLTHQLEPLDMVVNCNTFWGALPGTSGPEVPLAQRMKYRYGGSQTESGKFALFKIPVSGSSKNAAAINQSATWDPAITQRPNVVALCTVTVLPASGALPARGRFTATAGTFTVPTFQLTMSCTIAGSAASQNVGGNSTPPYRINQCVNIDNDGAWIEFSGNFVAEGPRTYTIAAGPPPIWPTAINEWVLFTEACVAAGFVPWPVWHWDDEGESDLEVAGQFADALDRFWNASERLFGQRIRGTPALPKLLSLVHSEHPWGTDEQLATVRAAVVSKAASLENAITLDPSDLPLDINDAGTTHPLVRQDHGIHLSPLGFLAKGFRADRLLGTFGGALGIPPHPNGELSSDGFQTVSGPLPSIVGSTDSQDGGTSSTGDASTGGDVAVLDSLTPEGADSILAQIEANWAAGGTDVFSYTVDGQTVTRNSPYAMIELHRYLSTLQARRSQPRRTRARFY